jgi:GNAT superfamily N-acetyltransferase
MGPRATPDALRLADGFTLRPLSTRDHEAVVDRSLALYRGDPGARRVVRADVRRTVAHFDAYPDRGAVWVFADGADVVCGYAILCAFWSNELGGLIAIVDELYIDAGVRGRGLASAFFGALARGRIDGFHAPVAIDLEVTRGNRGARRLYQRLGFLPQKNAGLRWRLGRSRPSSLSAAGSSQTPLAAPL